MHKYSLYSYPAYHTSLYNYSHMNDYLNDYHGLSTTICRAKHHLFICFWGGNVELEISLMSCNYVKLIIPRFMFAWPYDNGMIGMWFPWTYLVSYECMIEKYRHVSSIQPVTTPTATLVLMPSIHSSQTPHRQSVVLVSDIR